MNISKKTFIISILSFIVFSFATTKTNNQVNIYYFHGDYRCASCNKIENLTNSAIKENFVSHLKNEKIIFKLINVDKDKNKHFIEDYKLYTKSVILSKTVNGKKKWKNLDKIWQKLHSNTDFKKYIKDEVINFLEN